MNDVLTGTAQNAQPNHGFSAWDDIIQAIRSGKCNLLLGPELKSLRIRGEGQNKLSKATVYKIFDDFITGKLANPKPAGNKGFYYKAMQFINANYPGQPYKFKDEITKFKETYLQVP